ncbi:MAG TPA: sugar ABC transporter substrate-binding protein [Tepidisphaeraceae bacterium]
MKQLLIALVALAVVGCDSNSSTNRVPAPAATEKPRVALVMKSLANEFFRTMQDGAQAHQKAHAGDYELLSTGIKNETDVDKQIALVEQMIAQHVNAIVLAPSDSKALVPVCKKATDAGIVVVNIDNKLDADALKEKSLTVAFVGPNNMKGAKMAGEYLARKLNKGDAVAIIDGRPGAFNAVQRHDGFESAMKDAGMSILTSQSAQWETDKATPLVSSILQSNPKIKAFLCANDSMCLGAHTALKDAGKIGQVQLVGFDNIAAVGELVKKGDVLCTVDQHADQIAVNGIQYALEMLKTKSTPADKETAVDLVTSETLKK